MPAAVRTQKPLTFLRKLVTALHVSAPSAEIGGCVCALRAHPLPVGRWRGESSGRGKHSQALSLCRSRFRKRGTSCSPLPPRRAPRFCLISCLMPLPCLADAQDLRAGGCLGEPHRGR